MTAIERLREDAEYAFAALIEALNGVTESKAWAVLPPTGDEYLHTDGSIHGLVLHVAGGKRMYGSIAFRNSEVRWRDVAADMDGFEPSWTAALDYLHESHRYWLSTWANLRDEELNDLKPTNFQDDWAAWRIIRLVSHHDSYHAGQIAVLRYANGASATPPPSCADDVRQYCSDSRHW